MTVSVVIVDWNAGEALDGCLRSLAGEGATEVILVDNGSTDASVAAARARHPAVRVLATGENLGFAVGANRGAAAATGRVLVFLNPDARLLPGALATLVDALARTP
ncbi:MAG TPA: glycosyltransferase, partial [Candidatus Binatia bacterium]|nr:glycosyltransferase [Candidatus Binatia bacterium]